MQLAPCIERLILLDRLLYLLDTVNNAFIDIIVLDIHREVKTFTNL